MACSAQTLAHTIAQFPFFGLFLQATDHSRSSSDEKMPFQTVRDSAPPGSSLSRRCFRLPEIQPHLNPCHCLHQASSHPHSGTCSSSPPPQTPDRCQLRGRDQSFSGCPVSKSGLNLLRPLAKGSGMGMISDRCYTPGECQLSCCWKQKARTVCFGLVAQS